MVGVGNSPSATADRSQNRISARFAQLAVWLATGTAACRQAFLLARHPPLIGDEGHYAMNALRIAAGRPSEVDAFFSPLYSALSALPIRLGIDPEIACRGVNALLVTALVPGTAWLAGLLFGPAAAGLAAWAMFACPLAASLGATALSEPTATLLGTLALGAALSSDRGPSSSARVDPRFFLASVLAALAAVARSETAIFLLLVFLLACSGERGGRRRAVVGALAGAAVAFALIGVVFQINGWTRAFLSKGTINVSFTTRDLFDDPVQSETVIYGLTPEGDRKVDEEGRKVAARSLIPLAGRAVRRWPTVSANLLHGLASPFPIFLAAFACLASAGGGRLRAARWVLALGAAIPVATSASLFPMPRYVMPAIPPLLVLAAGGAVEHAASRESRGPDGSDAGARAKSHRLLALWTLLLVLVPLPFAVQRPLRQAEDVPRAYKETGEWMRRNLPAGRMAARPGTYVSYYAGIPEYTWIPAADATSTVRYMRKHGISYLVIDGLLPLEARPGFRELLASPEEAARGVGLEVVHSNGRTGWERVVVFRLASSDLSG